MGRKVYTNAFAGGEISPLMFGHIEDAGYRTGFARGRNFIVLPTGSAQKRPQFEFVRAAKSGQSPIRLLPFVYGDGDAYAMEWGPNHVRFHAEGTTLMYATPIYVASVDLSTDTFTTVSAHGLVVDQQVRITHKGTSIPGNLATGTIYYVQAVPSATTFRVATTSGAVSPLDLTTHSTIDETSFWKQSELPRDYITSKNVSSVNAGANSVNIVGHSLVAGDAVHFTGSLTFTADHTTETFTSVAHGMPLNQRITVSSSGTLPAGLTAGTIYFLDNVFANTFQLVTAGGTPVTITDNGTGTHTATLVDVLHSTPAVTAGVPYYVSIVDADNFKLHTTKAEALAPTVANTINILGIGGDTPRCHFAYYHGDIVWGGSLTISGSTSSRLFRCIADLTTSLPTVANWHQMPADGVYEVYTESFASAAVGDTNYDQSLDVMTITKATSAAYTVSRETATFPSGSSTTLDVTKFVFRSVDTSPGPDAPTLSLTSRVFGEYYNVSIPNGSFLLSASGTTNHGLIPGDIVYAEASIGSGTASAGVPSSPGFFIVTTVATNTFQMRSISGGAEIQNSSGATQNASVRRVNSSSRTSDTYVVTALQGKDESLASAELVVVNNLDVPGSSNVLSWTAVNGAERYRLYKKINEAFGLIIETDQLTATDDGIGPDLATQPPQFDNSLQTEYPVAVASFQQRPWFGGTSANPRRVWGGTTGTISTMSYHEDTPLDTDRIQIDVAAREKTLVRHIVPSSQLWVMTSSAEIKLTGQNTDVLSPVIGVDARPLSQVGCTSVRPIIANSNILFVGKDNQHVYEMPSQTLQIVDPPDLSIRAAHLFDEFSLVQSAQQKAPVPIEWYVRSDGALLGMTYMPEQNIRGWHVHTAAGTDAAIESVCVIPDSDGQRLYAVIARTINGSTVRHIERMGRISQPTTLTACKYLDSCVTYSGAPATSIPVAHLPGETVYAVADGRMFGPFTVSSGRITLGTAASTVHVGLLTTATVRSLPPAMLIEGYGKGLQVNASEVSLRVDQSCGFDVAVYSDDGIPRRSWPANGISNTALTSKDVPVPVEGSFGRNAQIEISQSSPFPLTIVSMTLDVTTGGP